MFASTELCTLFTMLNAMRCAGPARDLGSPNVDSNIETLVGYLSVVFCSSGPAVRLTRLLGQSTIVARAKCENHAFGNWLNQLEARSPRNAVVVAMANKLARIAWAVLTRGQDYRATACP